MRGETVKVRGKKRLFCVALAGVLWLTGCGSNQQQATGTDGSQLTAGGDNAAQSGDAHTGEGTGTAGNGEEAAVYYDMEEISLPDPDEGFEDRIPEGGWLWRKDPILKGEYIYRRIMVYTQEGMPIEDYLQVLKLSEMEWKNIALSGEFEIDGRQYSGFGEPFSATMDGELYCIVYPAEGEERFLGRLGENGIEEIVCTVPSVLIDDYWACAGNNKQAVLSRDRDGGFYYFHELGSSITCLGNAMQTQNEAELSGKILNLIQAGQGTDTCWYGTDATGKAVIGSVIGEKKLLDGFEGIGSEYMAAFSADGPLFLADTQKVWRADGEADKVREPEPVYELSGNGYIIKDLYGMEAGENGEVHFLVKLDKKITFLKLTETDKPQEKQEIVIAFTMPHLALSKSIARFNRQSERYYITVMLPEEKEEWGEFADRMRLEISAGGGPDILGHDVIFDIAPYVENDYLECLDGIIADESGYLQAALDGCRIDGKLYGIPYDCSFDFVFYSEADTKGCTAWTLPEMMTAVRASDAEILQEDYSGVRIVREYALNDNSDTTYIDWERGESHLTEQPFLDLLAFAKEYADDKNIQGEKAFAKGLVIPFDELRYMKEIYGSFEENPAIIGYPRAEGNGIYVNSRELYLNANSDCKEGAKEFFGFLLSEEEQLQYSAFCLEDEREPGQSLMGHKQQFPIYMGAYDALVEQEIKRDKKNNVIYTDSGIIQLEPLYTDEQIEKFYFLLHNAKPANYNAAALEDVIWEELAPYFAGDITAEQAAEKLDNRVQLYLDERAY